MTKKAGDSKLLAKIFNADGWQNFFTNLGTKKGRTANTTHGLGELLGHADFENLYRFTGFAKKVIDIPAYEMTREWISVDNDTDGLIENALNKIKAKPAFRNGVAWGSLFGGSLVIMGIDDSGTLDQPVNESAIRSVKWLRVYDRYQITWTTTDIERNPESEFYGEPAFYTINPYNTGTPFKVHASRVLRFNGSNVPGRTMAQNQGWGDSALQAIYDELRHYGIVTQSVVSIVEDFVQTILNIDNLTNMIADGQEDVVQKRLDIMDMTRSINNMVLLDGEESYSKSASTVTGLPEVMGQFALALAGVTGIPVTKLFGQAPAGLNATGESDTRNFYDAIKSKQEEIILPCLEKLVRYIQLSRDMGFGGKINPDLKIVFNPLWQLTDTQEADWKYKIAQTDEIYVRNGVLAPEEVTVSRFGNGFSPETSIDFKNRPAEPVDEPEKQ